MRVVINNKIRRDEAERISKLYKKKGVIKYTFEYILCSRRFMKSNKTEIAREYNKKTYDRICLTVKKGQRDKIKKFAKEKRNKSLNGYFVDLVEEDMKKV